MIIVLLFCENFQTLYKKGDILIVISGKSEKILSKF